MIGGNIEGGPPARTGRFRQAISRPTDHRTRSFSQLSGRGDLYHTDRPALGMGADMLDL
jgi:hypothetical protein